MKTKFVEIHLPYFKQGDDLRGCLEDTASVADARRAARLAHGRCREATASR